MFSWDWAIGFLMWFGLIEELESILYKDSKSYIYLMWRHLRGSLSWVSFPCFLGITRTLRRLRGDNISKEILAIKTKFSSQNSATMAMTPA